MQSALLDDFNVYFVFVLSVPSFYVRIVLYVEHKTAVVTAIDKYLIQLRKSNVI